jgi:hypothetical protein
MQVVVGAIVKRWLQPVFAANSIIQVGILIAKRPVFVLRSLWGLGRTGGRFAISRFSPIGCGSAWLPKIIYGPAWHIAAPQLAFRTCANGALAQGIVPKSAPNPHLSL